MHCIRGLIGCNCSDNFDPVALQMKTGLIHRDYTDCRTGCSRSDKTDPKALQMVVVKGPDFCKMLARSW
jgi:hypothetical protein